MELYEAIGLRRTIRNFAGRPVEPEKLERIIGAGLKAPTNDHMRNWEFVIIDDPETRAQLIERIPKSVTKHQIEGILEDWSLHDERQRQMYFDAIPKQYAMLFKAGALILPLFKQEKPLLEPKNLSELNGLVSIWCCIENMLLAAASEGVFGVTRIPLGDEAEYIRQIVGYPQNYTIPCWLALGYPAEDAVRPEQYNFDPKQKIHKNRW